MFTNILLADEINRTPPKTQAALLEAMQERQISVEGEPRPLPDPFLVLATQNPIEYEGTYPLPEAQLDRFLFQVNVGYPSEDEELELLGTAHSGVVPTGVANVKRALTAKALAALKAEVDSTRGLGRGRRIRLGGDSPHPRPPERRPRRQPARGHPPAGGLQGAARGWTAASSSPPTTSRGWRPPVLRHRLILSPEAELERYTTDQAIATALAEVPVPK